MRPLSGEVINEPRLELGLTSGQASLRDDPTIGAALSVYSALRSGEDSLSKEIAGLANNLLPLSVSGRSSGMMLL
ncbi:MAG: hypothetical protein PsegKO_33530 [Pseudohongiellaceae bacterium]